MSDINLDKIEDPSRLDDVTYEAASGMASRANNDGLEGQLYFLRKVAGWSDEDIRRFLLPPG